MKSDIGALPVAIVGGGFSGIMAAVQLARRDVPNVVIDGSGRIGRGVAYSTCEPAHLLNVPSGKMSAWPDAPDNFQRWLGDDGSTFAERRQFGRYVEEILGSTRGVSTVEQACVAAQRTATGWRLQLADGTQVEARALVLAQGNQPPVPFGAGEELPDELFVNNPWSLEAAAGIKRVAGTGGDVLLIGTGLTMIDSVLSLSEAGHQGRIIALSRRGLMPRAHAPYEAVPVSLNEVPLGNVLILWQWLRHRCGEVGFRAAVDSLRPHTRAIWQSWSHQEQRRFLRHVRPWWDVHRHRIAPQIAQRLAGLIDEGRLEIVAGRLCSLSADGQAVITRRDGREVRQGFRLAINCTGPLGDLGRTNDSLLRQLLDAGAIELDPHRLGLRVDERSRAGERLWALGPLTKGMYWEIVAVPDIRGQAAEVAEDIARELGAG